jgi:CDP-diacylglycerol--glycerol-3-phosphate 3-phosphatidyltransferase
MATLLPSTRPTSKPNVFNLPNQLTAARFVLALILFGLIRYEVWAWCLGVFAVAAFTDWLDGYLARKQNLTSPLGRNLLPLGEAQGWLTAWMVTVVVARELVITSLRSYLEMTGAVFGADWLGKLKMGLQCAAVIAIFIALGSKDWFPDYEQFFGVARDGLVYAMLAATLLSGLQYIWRAFLLYRADRLS